MKELRGQMKPVSEMTDQELNVWVKKTIFAPWVNLDNHKEARVTLFIQEPDFCNNLNHAYLMEEKIKELGKEKDFSRRLEQLIFIGLYPSNKDPLKKFGFYLAHASARQRCEAAYLVLSNL